MRVKGLLFAALSIVLILPVSGYGEDSSHSRGSRLYVSNAGNSTISVIDIPKKEVVATFRAGVWPAGMALDPAAGRLYIANSSEGDSTISVIDVASNSELKKIKVGIGPMAVILPVS